MSISTSNAPTAATTSSGTGLVPLTNAGGLEIFPLNLGGNVFGWTTDVKESEAVLDAFVEAGGNLVDTANVYSVWAPGNVGGESESILGDWLTDRGHHGVIHIATKVGMLNDEDLSAESVRSALTVSLERLRADSVALYYAHRDEETRPAGEIVETFAGLVADGLIRSYGLSNWNAPRLQAALAYADEHGLPRPAALQNPGSAVRPEDADVSRIADAHGVVRLPYSTLASGFLTGKYRRGAALPESARAAGVDSTFADDHGWAVLDAVTEVAAARGVPVAAIALAWLRSTGAVPIASARTPEQLAPLLTGVKLELSAGEFEAIAGAGQR